MTILVARTGIEPVVSALRGRRVKPITLPGHFGHSIALQRLWAILRKITPGFRNARLPQYANHRQDVRFSFFDSLHRVFRLTVGIPARYPSAGRRVPCWRGVAAHKIQEERIKYLTDEKRIKAVTVLFSDLEGRLHMLDYDKKFLIKSWDNLTFDGSSIRGFTAQRESDLRLGIDWGSFYWAPADYFGSGKVLVFGEVIDKDGTSYGADIRGVLKSYAQKLYDKEGYTLNAANEIEGFLFKGPDAERHYHESGKFEYVNTGGYYHSLPGDPLRNFIDISAEVQRSMGFQNEKDHPEVAPSQFEINYGYGEVVAAADQI